MTLRQINKISLYHCYCKVSELSVSFDVCIVTCSVRYHAYSLYIVNIQEIIVYLSFMEKPI